MSAESAHPSVERWEAFVEGSLESDVIDELQQHLDQCRQCRGEVDLLQLLGKAGQRSSWKEPSTKALERSLRLPDDPEIPELPSKLEELELASADIRGASTAAVGGAQLLARNHPDARITVMARPPAEDGRWLITGRVWPRAKKQSPITVVLTDHDHVLHRVQLRRGETFRIEEVASAGWKLEIHLPGGSCLLVPNPIP